MKLEESGRARRKERLEVFLDPTPPINYVPPENYAGSIYIITNITNGKRYIGQADNFDERVRTYVSYSDPQHHITGRLTRMYKIIRDEGIENFRMRRLLDATDKISLAHYEIQFIRELHTIEPNGYNLNLTLDIADPDDPMRKNKRSISQKGRRHSAIELARKSEPCIVVDADEKRIWKCESIALFLRMHGIERVQNRRSTSDLLKGCMFQNRYYVYTNELLNGMMENPKIKIFNRPSYVYYGRLIRDNSTEELRKRGYRIYTVKYPTAPIVTEEL